MRGSEGLGRSLKTRGRACVSPARHAGCKRDEGTAAERWSLCEDEEYLALLLTGLIIDDVSGGPCAAVAGRAEQRRAEQRREKELRSGSRCSGSRKSGDGVRKMGLKHRQFSWSDILFSSNERWPGHVSHTMLMAWHGGAWRGKRWRTDDGKETW